MEEIEFLGSNINNDGSILVIKRSLKWIVDPLEDCSSLVITMLISEIGQGFFIRSILVFLEGLLILEIFLILLWRESNVFLSLFLVISHENIHQLQILFVFVAVIDVLLDLTRHFSKVKLTWVGWESFRLLFHEMSETISMVPVSKELLKLVFPEERKSGHFSSPMRSIWVQVMLISTSEERIAKFIVSV